MAKSIKKEQTAEAQTMQDESSAPASLKMSELNLALLHVCGERKVKLQLQLELLRRDEAEVSIQQAKILDTVAKEAGIAGDHRALLEQYDIDLRSGECRRKPPAPAEA